MKKGEIRTIFYDYQEDRDPIGVARLGKFVETGLPFILKETKESATIVYNTQIWEVEFLELTDLGETLFIKKKYPIRFVESVGNKTSSESTETKSSDLVDKFIKFKGKEIF